MIKSKEIDPDEWLEIVDSSIRDTLVTLENKSEVARYEIRIFSDNFIIGFSKGRNIQLSDKNQFFGAICRIVGMIQCNLLKKYGVLLRGCITEGKLYFAPNYVFGEGLVKAVEMEASGEYPSIEIDAEVIKKYVSPNELPYGYLLDSTGRYVVDYLFEYDIKMLNDIPRKTILTEISKINQVLIGLINKNGKYKNNLVNEKAIEARDRIIRKYLWVLVFHNSKYLLLNLPKSQLIPYQIVLNERYMRAEIKM